MNIIIHILLVGSPEQTDEIHNRIKAYEADASDLGTPIGNVFSIQAEPFEEVRARVQTKNIGLVIDATGMMTSKRKADLPCHCVGTSEIQDLVQWQLTRAHAQILHWQNGAECAEHELFQFLREELPLAV